MNRTTTSLNVIAFFVMLMGSGFLLFSPYANAQENETPTNTDPNVLKGGITSIQDDNPDDDTEWITGGAYRMENINSTSPMFNASFYMVRTDGNASHSHDIYDFVLVGEPMSNGNHTVFNGTSTVTMREGPIAEVPTTITLLGDSGISIFVDPVKTNNHFGNTAIYGTQFLICVEAPQICE